MKTLFIYIALIISMPLCAQIINFEDPVTTDFLSLEIDTVNYPDNIWHIGRPLKQIFSSAYSPENVIVTDTVNHYPVNDTSAFLLKLKLQNYRINEIVWMNGYYQVHSDSLSDYGTLELSLDNGASWIDLLNSENDFNSLCVNWYWIKPTFTGNSKNWQIPDFKGWQYFDFELNFYSKDCQPDHPMSNGGIILFRFGFISDGIQTNKEGLMFDEIRLIDHWEGLNNFALHFHSNAFPNPTNGPICIEFDNTKLNNHSLFVFDSHGKRVLEMALADKNCIELDLGDYPPGLYFYKLINQKDQSTSHGRLIKM